MANNPIAGWFWKIFRLTVVLLLISGLVDVLMIASRRGTAMFRTKQPTEKSAEKPEEKPPEKSAKEILKSKISDSLIREPTEPNYPDIPSRYDSFRNNPDTAKRPILNETLRLEVTPETIFARYDVYLAKDHPLFEFVKTTTGANSANILVTDVLGPVDLNGTPLKFYPAETSVAADDPNAHIYLTSQPIKPTSHDYRVSIASPDKSKSVDLHIEKREVVVQTDGAQVWSYDGNALYSRTSRLTVFTRPAAPNFFSLDIHFPEWTPIESERPAPTPEPTPKPTLGEILSQSVSPPGLGTLLYGLLGALPFLLFLYWTRKYGFEEKQSGFRLKVEAIQIYLAVHFAPYFVFALDELIRRWGNPAINVLRYFQRHTITAFDLRWSREHEVLLPLMVMFAYLWPSMIVRWERREFATSERWKGRAGQILFVLTLIALLVWAGTRIYKVADSDFESLSVVGFFSYFASILLVGLVGASAWLAVEVFDRRKAGAALLIFLVFVVLLAASTLSYLAAVKTAPAGIATANKIISIAVFIVTAFMLVSGFARLTYRVVSGQSVSQVWKTWGYQKRGLVVLAIILVSVSTRFWPADYWRLTSLAFELKELFMFALVWILVDFLKEESRDADWLQLPPSTRQAGILLALVMFYHSTTRWNYIPVEFLLGLVLLDNWLLPTKRFDQSLFAEIRGQLPRIIQKIIDFNDAEKALGSLKKELLSKVGKGELTYEQYLEKLKAQGRAVDDLKSELTIQGQFAKNVVLAFGPTDSAWENGKKAALYSLWFSTPWTVLFLRNMVRAPAFEGSYLIIDVLSSIIFFLLAWVSYGFIFGYFYPYIKGNDGIQKSLSLFLTIVIPNLAWNALARPLDTEKWSLFSLWVLQVFVHIMLLGLIAGDYETLRKAGFRWKHLLEIHRVGALSAWASSVLIAIGAAVSTLITSGAVQLITSAFKFTAQNSPLPPPTAP